MPANAPAIPAVPDALAAILAPGESVLWSEQPRPYVYILRGMTSIAYGATWAILGSFWYHGSGGVGKYSAFEGWWRLIPLLSLPFILAGLSFFIHPARRARAADLVCGDEPARIHRRDSGEAAAGTARFLEP
jgi:hypothetical protein